MTTTELDFDPEVLRAKYREERDKRIRPDGNDQYIEVVGEFARFVEDPYTTWVEREPLTDSVEAVVLGGGFGGLLAGAHLRQAGLAPGDIRLIEKGGDFGGTWYWNRYPGAQCDIESYIYLPLLEELGYIPTEKYAHAPEILAHSQAIGRHFGLYDNAVFQAEVSELRWDDADARWVVSTNRGDRMRARFVVSASGPLHRPKLPGVPGIRSFRGHTFHTSRWDYAYTGGDSNGNLDKLADKVIGIIGTGATAVQCVPHLGAAAKHLYVFQRTPSSIDVRNNRPTDPDWAASLEPGWQRRRMENFNNLVSGIPEAEDLVADGWTDIFAKLVTSLRRGDADLSPKGIARAMELADFEKMNQVRARAEQIVADAATAEALKPWYRQFCKRPCFHDEYLQTFNRPNVTLVDTQGKGIDRITERGVVANGAAYDLDCLIFATGFEVGTDYSRRSGCTIVGRDGVTLSEKWAGGVRTLHGMHSRGFPNLFFVNSAQAGFTANFPHALDEMSQHVAYVVDHARRNGARMVEASAEAEEAWVRTIVDLARMGRSFFESCTPGYYNNEGKPGERSAQDGSYGAGSVAFFRVLSDWRAEGSLAGLELTS